jgi:predicted GIY-YIG superfamily endonuclease
VRRPKTEAKPKEVSVEKLLTDEKDKRKTDGTWFVYILRCGDGTLYTGITNDLTRRCGQHNAGTASRYTRSRLQVELVYQEVQASRSHALKRELTIKALSRQEKKTLMKDGRKTRPHCRTIGSSPLVPVQYQNRGHQS